MKFTYWFLYTLVILAGLFTIGGFLVFVAGVAGTIFSTNASSSYIYFHLVLRGAMSLFLGILFSLTIVLLSLFLDFVRK